MSKYASGLTFGQVCNIEKEQIKNALNGKLVVGENADGFVYEPASKEDCDKFILGAYDEVVFQALQSMESGRVLEKMMARKYRKNPQKSLYAYLKFQNEIEHYDDYKFEGCDEDDLREDVSDGE